MNIKRGVMLVCTVSTGLILALTWSLFLSGKPGLAIASSYTVCPAGPPTCDYGAVQSAVDAASAGDVIKVAQGTYTGVNNRGGLAQVVYIDKSVTIQGLGVDTTTVQVAVSVSVSGVAEFEYLIFHEKFVLPVNPAAGTKRKLSPTTDTVPVSLLGLDAFKKVMANPAPPV